ncbi:MAG: DUF2116 family Zn-ribbon domain-containing protein [Methanobrevibacter sp.]|jgi:predicted nucleic acid-binding Zn ribbon protein|nr:DUF2116 family Zn-ribbon domain-containing protein [Methanobrevibacter sp.]
MVDVHKHCPICGTPIPLEEFTCSNKCQMEYNNRMAKSKKSRLMSFAIMVLFIIVGVAFVLFRNKII